MKNYSNGSQSSGITSALESNDLLNDNLLSKIDEMLDKSKKKGKSKSSVTSAYDNFL